MAENPLVGRFLRVFRVRHLRSPIQTSSLNAASNTQPKSQQSSEFSQRLLDKRVTALFVSPAKTTQYCIFKLFGSGNVIHDQTDTCLAAQEAPDPLQENRETQAAS
jgi:hypothetical protein